MNRPKDCPHKQRSRTLLCEEGCMQSTSCLNDSNNGTPLAYQWLLITPLLQPIIPGPNIFPGIPLTHFVSYNLCIETEMGLFSLHFLLNSNYRPGLVALTQTAWVSNIHPTKRHGWPNNVFSYWLNKLNTHRYAHKFTRKQTSQRMPPHLSMN